MYVPELMSVIKRCLLFGVSVNRGSTVVTSPMCGGEVAVLIVCIYVCVCVTAPAGATHTLQAQLRYQKKVGHKDQNKHAKTS